MDGPTHLGGQSKATLRGPVTTSDVRSYSVPAGGCGAHLQAVKVRGVVETHRRGEVLDAVSGGGREEALRPRD